MSPSCLAPGWLSQKDGIAAVSKRELWSLSQKQEALLWSFRGFKAALDHGVGRTGAEESPSAAY